MKVHYQKGEEGIDKITKKEGNNIIKTFNEIFSLALSPTHYSRVEKLLEYISSCFFFL